MTWRILIPIFLAAAVFVIYWQIQDYEYINFDDDLYVTDNERVKEGLSSASLAWAFKAIDPYWHPVTWLSHMLDYQL